MAHDLKELELSVLYDLLASYTALYTQMLRWGSPSGILNDCGKSILELQIEIDFRKTEVDIVTV